MRLSGLSDCSLRRISKVEKDAERQGFFGWLDKHPGIIQPCSCGAREGKSSNPLSPWAHEDDCESQKSWDVAFQAWGEETGGWVLPEKWKKPLEEPFEETVSDSYLEEHGIPESEKS